MRITWEQYEGILLQVIPYLGNAQILKIFTLETGLLTAMAKQKINAIPFSRSEWIVRKSRGEFFSLKEVSLRDPYHQLRSSYRIIAAAGSIANDLLRSQLPSKPSPHLYRLVLAYFSHLPTNPEALAQSFRLKLLQTEGVFRIEPNCSRCKSPSRFLSEGESVCEQHRSLRDLFFECDEWQIFMKLGTAERFSELNALQISSQLSEKIEQLFLRSLAR